MDNEEKYKKALNQIYNVLGPTQTGCIKCQGCSMEWDEALRILRDTLNICGASDGHNFSSCNRRKDHTGKHLTLNGYSFE